MVSRMKTAIDLDDKKLLRVMKLTGLKTRKEAIDFALTEAERLAGIKKLLQEHFYVDASGHVVDPNYDTPYLRESEKPGR